jgi:hypothetical protein
MNRNIVEGGLKDWCQAVVTTKRRSLVSIPNPEKVTVNT